MTDTSSRYSVNSTHLEGDVGIYHMCSMDEKSIRLLAFPQGGSGNSRKGVEIIWYGALEALGELLITYHFRTF